MNEYLATFRFSTGQFEYVEITATGTPESLKSQYIELQKALKSGTGLPDKDFNRVLDRYLWGDGSMSVEELEGLNDDQAYLVQAIKRSKKRNNYNNK